MRTPLLLFAGLALALQPLAAADAVTPTPAPLRHVVSFKFKDGTTADQIRKVEAAFKALPGKIRQIQAFEWGTNISPEKLNQGFTHCFLLTFKTAKDRDEYLVHPDHKAFAELVGPVVGDVFVIDFQGQP